nr:serine hydrolase [Solirubrobacterales bacterium]
MTWTLPAALIATLMAVAPAQAAKRCEAPAGAWERATPAEAGMDAARVRGAVNYATTQNALAVRVYRHGCLVARDALAPVNGQMRFESWSLAKSVTALVFSRAMTLGLISPDDPVGALIGEADAPHGAITMRDLLTMTSGLRWNGFRDYDVFMPDRLRDALTVGVARPPGTYYEYSQSGPALLAEAVQRAVGEDFQAFAQRELFGPLGIRPGTWRWSRDAAGHTQGFFGLNMHTDDFARLGELMRREGVWRGRRLLARPVVREALTPTSTNGCYGWLIWLNAARPCVGPRIGERPVSDDREFPGLPRDLYRYAGLFGQLVSVFPSQGLVVVRNGTEAVPALSGSGSGGYEGELYRRLLAAITDKPVKVPDAAPDAGGVDRTDVDAGFQASVFEPQEYTAPFGDGPLPAAGPERARAARLRLA